MQERALTLLYIDDDEGLRRLVERNLMRQGITVVLAADGISGIARAQQGDIDVVALDHYMGGLDGIATLERLRAIPDAPPVVFVTGAQESRIAVSALKTGAVDYVIKDTSGDFIPLLRVAVENAYAIRRMTRAKEDAEAEVRQARDRFEALAAERAVLLREVNHRVGNSLQLIAAMLHLQASSNTSQEVGEALTQATTRVMAVAQLHRRLYTSDDVKAVAVDQYLEALIEDLGRSSSGSAPSRVSLEADPISIDPDRAVAIGVIVNELVLNSLKYAYANANGPIRVTLKAVEPDRCMLTVEDDGVGYGAVSKPESTGLGQRIVRAMAAKLGADLSFDPRHKGARTLVTFALSAAQESYKCKAEAALPPHAPIIR